MNTTQAGGNQPERGLRGDPVVSGTTTDDTRDPSCSSVQTPVETLIARLENYYDFECQGGPLKNCAEWQQLKSVVSQGPPMSELVKRANWFLDRNDYLNSHGIIRDLLAALTTAQAQAEERDEAYGYLSRLFERCAPQCRVQSTLPGLATQIDNYIAGCHQRLEAAEAQVQSLTEQLTTVTKERDEAKENAMAWFRSEEMQGQHADAMEERAEAAERRVAAVIEATEKHCRALHFKTTTPDNIAALVDAICETDSRHVQELQTANRQLTSLQAGIAELEKAWQARLDDYEAAPASGPMPLSSDEGGMLSECLDRLRLLREAP